MKKLLLLSSFLFIASLAFCQHQPPVIRKSHVDSSGGPLNKPSPKLDIVKKQVLYSVTLDANEINNLFAIIRSSGKLTGAELETYLGLLSQRIKEIKQ